jgi:hypothetical protein
MTTWNYIIGSEKDFEGAPDWATMLTQWGDYDDKYFVESNCVGAKILHTTSNIVYTIVSTVDEIGMVIIAQREPATAHNMDSKYNRPCKGITIDVYDVLKAFNVTCPALQHLIKKALAVGQRGHKDASEDLKDILASAKRAIELSEGK